MIFAGILAGGKGTRVGTNVPKQFLELNGKPVLIRTVNTFLEVEQCDIIYISVNASKLYGLGWKPVYINFSYSIESITSL